MSPPLEGTGVLPPALLLGLHLECAIVTNGDFTESACDSASTVGAAVWGDACGGPKHCCIRCGSTSCKGKGKVLGVFVPHFHNGKCHWVAVKCFRFVFENLTISAPQMYRWKAQFMGLLAIYSVSRSTLGFMRNWQNRNDCSTKTSAHAAKLPA